MAKWEVDCYRSDIYSIAKKGGENGVLNCSEAMAVEIARNLNAFGEIAAALKSIYSDPACFTHLSIDHQNVLCEAIKEAEAGNV
jgi:hypothetical protein